MGKRFKDKHSVKEEKREKKRQMQNEIFIEKRQVEPVTNQIDRSNILQETKTIEIQQTTQNEKITEQPKKPEVPKKSKKKSKKNKIIFFLIIIICILIAPAIYLNENKDIADNTIKTITNGEFNNEITEDGKTEIVDADIPDKMGEYNVLGKIVIDKIGVEKNILDQTSDASLKLSVTKFYGPNINEVGNLCLSGHNYKDTFGYLGRMEKEDTFYIIDKENFEKVIYRVYDKFTVNSTELDCLDQETEGKREVTLITCNPGGVTRLIIKACEV